MIELLITDRKVSILHTEQIVSGNRNTYTVHYRFGQNCQVDWKHCMKVAVFASVSPIGAKKVRIAKLDDKDCCLIPQSILMHDAATVFAGVSGVYPNEDVIASQMRRIGTVDPGANGETFPMDEVPQSVMDGFLADVAELLAETSEKSHTHANMDTLDRIGADGDNLTFDGVSVGGNDRRVDGLISDVSALQQASHTHANMDALERIGQDTDDVVLLPFGEPLDLYLRADYFNLQYPNHRDYQAIGIEVKSTDNRYIGVYGDDGSGVMLRYYDGETITESYNGFQWSNGSSIQPVDQPITDFSVDSVGYFDGVEYVTFFGLEAINGDRYAKFIYRLFCQIFNTSTENMGSIDIIDNAIEGNITSGLKWGRTYNITVTGNSYELVFDNSAERPIDILGLENDAYCVVYLTLEQDCDIVHEATYLVNGESPNTTAGRHKWIFNRLPNGQISLGALDLEAVV